MSLRILLAINGNYDSTKQQLNSKGIKYLKNGMGELIKLNLIPDLILRASQTPTIKTAEEIKNILSKNTEHDIPLIEEKNLDSLKGNFPKLQTIFKNKAISDEEKTIMFVLNKKKAFDLALKMTGDFNLEIKSFNAASISGYTFKEDSWEGFTKERKKSSSMNIFYNRI